MWYGPFKVNYLLKNCFDEKCRPPLGNGVYLVSKKRWQEQPTRKCQPLYVGSNTGSGERFRTRIGDLIADMFGFFTPKTGHHQGHRPGHSSGGQSLYKDCRKENVNPGKLYIGWLHPCGCALCEEARLYHELKPLLNKRVPRCPRH